MGHMVNRLGGDVGQGSGWGARLFRLARCADGPVAVVASRDHGANHLAALVVGSTKGAVWARFDVFDRGDRVSQGNRVGDALERAFGASVVGHGLPVDYVMNVAVRLVQATGPTWFVFSDVENAPETCREVAALHKAGARVLLIGARLDEMSLAGPTLVLGEQEVQLRHEDLVALRDELGSDVPVSSLERLAVDAGGRYLSLLVALHRAYGLPPVIVPEPGGASLADSPYEFSEPQQVVSALVARGAQGDALEIAIRSDLKLSEDLVARGAQSMEDRGLYQRLFALLDGLDAAVRRSSPEMMKWYFIAATATNQHRRADVRAEVASYLEDNSAPELLALFAAAFPGPEFLEVSERALGLAATPLTLRIHAFALSQSAADHRGAQLLMRAMRKADALGYRGQVMASAADLCDFWLKRGRYREAREWSEWALQYHERNGLRDGLRALVALGLGAFVRMLTGDLIGVEDTVRRLDTSLSGVPTVEALISTRADWHFLNGEFSKAADLYRINVESAGLGQYAFAAVDLIHALVHLGQLGEAEAIAQRALALTRGSGEVLTGIANLSYGLVLCARGDVRAVTPLLVAQEALREGIEAHKLAQATIALGRVHIRAGDADAARSALKRGAQGLAELAPSGWRLLGGFQEEVETLRRLFTGEQDALELALLGDGRVSLGQQRLALGLRHKEILAVLALNPGGLSAEELGEKVYGDAYNFSSLKATVSKLRRLVPIASRPYTIALDVRADFIHVQELVAAGRLREAVAHYRGALLPASQAPEIVEWRTHLEELVRAAVLREGDPELLLRLASVVSGDLELVEAVLRVIPPHDDRYPTARALRARLELAWSRD